MKRLTTYEPVEGGIPFVTVKNEQDALQRLAAYEDTGLEPEEITQAIGGERAIFSLYSSVDQERVGHIHDLLKAEEEGRLVILSCKNGCKVE